MCLPACWHEIGRLPRIPQQPPERRTMTSFWKRWAGMACLLMATSTAFAQKANSLVVDGTDWMSASVTERRAFLIGAANMIMAEGAYAKRRNVSAPPVGERITKAADSMKIGEIEARITRWYETNAGKLSTPVMGVVWQDIVKAKQ
jgi:hypothetical protein